MSQLSTNNISELGYNFIDKKFIPKGKNEYYLRNIQNRSGIKYRNLTPEETDTLIRNANNSDNWNNVLVADGFNPSLVKNNSFYGLVRIGKLELLFHQFNNLRLPVGIYNSRIISCDIGENVVIENVNYMSHYIIGNNVMLVNINELDTTNRAKFGNGVLKEGESEAVRIWIEVCNENAGRSVLPFNGIEAADAWLWSKYRDDEKLLSQLKKFTDERYDTKRGYYGKIGDRTVIKHCRIIKDAWIGSDAYIKGANKLKNLTINSSPEAKSQIGEGCELVNGIIGYGCRIFYGVKAVRFVLGSNSQLKYGARLINSYLAENSTISCCEVLNSLIFPGHEQHHNNSFLCASTISGQSNMAAGATIGSNHNSRGADGEIVAGRGFWPGLCVSLKHNSKFASYTIIAKGDFPAELNISIPFSLVSNDVSNDRLVVMPAYWFMYNMYALCRNVNKYDDRDRRTDKSRVYEYGFLAPDSVNEMFDSLGLMADLTANAYSEKNKKNILPQKIRQTGKKLLENEIDAVKKLVITTNDFENTRRKTVLIKVPEAYQFFKTMISYYGITELIRFIESSNINSWEKLQKKLPGKAERKSWKNLGGQLIPENDIHTLIRNIRSNKIASWDDVHTYYSQKSKRYATEKFNHAFASLLEVESLTIKSLSKKKILQLLDKAVATREWMTENIKSSREKDYSSPFRKMVYDTEKEMEKVLGALKDNSFIQQQVQETLAFKEKIRKITEIIK